MSLQKKHIIKVPQNIKIIYDQKKQLLTLMGDTKTKSLKLKVIVFILPSPNIIVISQKMWRSQSSLTQGRLKSLQQLTVVLIRQSLTEIVYVLYSKLKLIGVGYKVFPVGSAKGQLNFKLGYSHSIYFKIPENIVAACPKQTKISLYGDVSYDKLTQLSASIRACKTPEPYKGKGVLYEKETLVLKRGKKI